MANDNDYRRNGAACLQFATTCDDTRRVFWLEMAQKWFRLADSAQSGVDPLNTMLGIEVPPDLPSSGSDEGGGPPQI